MDLHRDPSLSVHSARSRSQRVPERPNRLGRALREARLDKDLELRDLAEITSVRLTHLEALEAGDYQGLPEEVYSKNFIRLYAQAVGLDPARMLLLYGHERHALAGVPHAPGAELELPLTDAPRFISSLDNPRLTRALGLLLTPLLVVVVVLAALWAFNGLFTAAPDTTEPQLAASEPAAAEPAEMPTETPAQLPATLATPEMTPEREATGREATGREATQTPANAMVLLSLRTTPPGAEVSIDGYRFGQSPIIDAPVRVGTRAVRIEQGGYQPFERTLNMNRDRHLNIELLPKGALTGAGTPQAPAPSTNTQAVVTLTVTAEAWLEVYAGSARGKGERLVYKTAQPGETFSFSAPVYVFSGNAGGVTVARGDAAEPLGASGAVVGAAYD